MSQSFEAQMENESRARIGSGVNLATDALSESRLCWVLVDQDFSIHSVLVTLHETAEGARSYMLAAARGYLDQPKYKFGDFDDHAGERLQWEDRFWIKDVCALHIERKEIHNIIAEGAK